MPPVLGTTTSSPVLPPAPAPIRIPQSVWTAMGLTEVAFGPCSGKAEICSIEIKSGNQRIWCAIITNLIGEHIGPTKTRVRRV